MTRAATAALLVALAVLAAVPATASAQPAAGKAPPPMVPALEARGARLLSNLRPGVRPKLDPGVRELLKRAEPPAPVPGRAPPPPVDLAAVARSSVTAAGPLEGLPLDDAVVILFALAAKQARADLREQLAKLDAINAQKAATRAALAALKASREATKSTKACASLTCIDAIGPSTAFSRADLEAVKKSLAATAEAQREAFLSEQDALRLQMILDRQQKAYETLSNIMKKLDETAETIIKNLK